METLARDLRYVIRSLRRNPGFFFITVVTLALGVGATTAIFSVVNAVLLQPLPYPSSDRIVQLFQVDKDGKRMSVSEPNFADWQSQTRGFVSMAELQGPGRLSVTGTAEPMQASAATVSGDFFRVFGLKPEIGRTVTAAEVTAGAPVVVVSDAFWRHALGGNPAAVGRPINLDNQQYVVAAVMPPAMDYPAGTEVWMPSRVHVERSRTSHGWRVVARLRDGVTLPQAKADLSAVSRRLKQTYGDETWMSDGDLSTLHDQLVGNVRTTLLVLLGASAFLLLIACAAVTNLLVARMTIRRAELGVRLALGASRTRLARQALTETGLLALVGGAAGVLLATVGVRALLALQTGALPRAGEVHVNGSVLAFALATSAVVAVGLGLLATLQGTRADIRETLSSGQRTQAGSGTSARVRSGLVVSQMALTVVLLVGAGLLARSFANLLEINPGYRTTHALVLDAALPYERGDQAALARANFHARLVERLRSIPGVTDVGSATGFPLLGGGSDGEYLILDRADVHLDFSDWTRLAQNPQRSGQANFRVADVGYFRALNIPVLRGRGFEPTDALHDANDPYAPDAALVSASLAKAKWPNENPIGKLIEYGNMDGNLRPYTVVGVVGDVRDQSLAVDPTPTFYANLAQRPNAAGNLHIVLRAAGDPTPVIASARAIVQQLRPDVPVRLQTVETIVSGSMASRRFVLVLVGVFGFTALGLATLGVYSVISYLVAQRRPEIGVRIALGAQSSDVLRLVLRQGAVLALSGVAVGTIAAMYLTRLLKGLVYGVSTTDPIAFGGVVALLVVVALVASFVPARRATRVDPMSVLRT
jgi:putative ABC transport system permease protein